MYIYFKYIHTYIYVFFFFEYNEDALTRQQRDEVGSVRTHKHPAQGFLVEALQPAVALLPEARSTRFKTEALSLLHEKADRLRLLAISSTAFKNGPTVTRGVTNPGL